MTQPAVSNHLHVLEERFGLPLLSRGRPLKPTLAGECLARYARRILRDVTRLESEMARHSGPSGRLVAGASSTPAELLLPRLVVAFASRYPDVALDVRVDDTDKIIAALLGRELEVAIVGRELSDRNLSSRIVEIDELIPVIASSDRFVDTEISPEDLAGHPFVLRERGSATRRAVEEGLAAAGIRPRVVMELGSNAAVAGAIEAGAGVGVVPARTVSGRPDVARLTVRGLTFTRPFVLVTERERPLSPAAKAFVGICTGEEPS